jgi:hypothetical protein
MFVSCTVFVLSGRGLCDGPIPRPEESYRMWCVLERDQVKNQTLYTCCEQVGRRWKDYKTKQISTRFHVVIYLTLRFAINILHNFSLPYFSQSCLTFDPSPFPVFIVLIIFFEE